jgi:biopolymer transport protein TolR
VAPLEVQIRADKSLYLRDLEKSNTARKISRGELVEAVKAQQERNPEQAVVISADKSVRYEEVLKVMDELQLQQVKKVGLLTKPRAG